MRRSILLAAVLAGGLSLAAAAEARGRHGHDGSPGRMVHHSHCMVHHGQQFAQPSSLRRFAPRPRGRHFGHWHDGPRFGHWHDGPRFGHRPPDVRLLVRQPVPLSRQPGYRSLAGRQIVWVLGLPAARPIVVPRSPRFPSFVRVGPGPGLPPPQAGFGIARRSGGPTIIVRDPAIPPWQ